MSDHGNGTLEKLKTQSMKALMDVILLCEIRKGMISGYDALSVIHKKFDVLLSSGTMYAHLYALEREGLIEGHFDPKKRVYSITEKGQKILHEAAKTNIDMLLTLKEELRTSNQLQSNK